MREASAPSRLDVLLGHMHDTTAWLVPMGAPCDEQARREVRAVRRRKKPQPTGRDVRLLAPDRLAKHRPTGSWIVVVWVCPGADAAMAIRWASTLTVNDIDRILPVLHPKVDTDRAATDWAGAGLPPVSFRIAANQRRLHPILRRAVNRIIRRDHREPWSSKG